MEIGGEPGSLLAVTPWELEAGVWTSIEAICSIFTPKHASKSAAISSWCATYTKVRQILTGAGSAARPFVPDVTDALCALGAGGAGAAVGRALTAAPSRAVAALVRVHRAR